MVFVGLIVWNIIELNDPNIKIFNRQQEQENTLIEENIIPSSTWNKWFM